MDLFKLAATITLNDKEFKNGIKNAQKNAETMGTGISKSFGFVKKAAGVAFTAVGAAATFATKKGMDFEAQMSKVGAISGASANDLQKLTDKAKELGVKTKFSATEAGQAFEYMSMAGWKTGDMLDGVSGIMDLAAASGEDLALTSDIVTDALTAFGKSAKESGRLADIMAATSSNSNTNVAMLGETFKYVAPVAGALKFSMEDTALAIGLMANAGIKGSQAGTSLRAGLTNLVKPTDAMYGVMEKYGISVEDSAGKMKSFHQIMVELRGAFGGLDEATKASAVATLFGKEAMSGWLAVINASNEDFEKLMNSIDGSTGAAKNMAEQMNNNLKGQLTLLGSSLESLGIAFYERFKEPMTNGVKTITEALNKLVEKLNNGELDRTITTIGFLATTLATTLGVLKGYMTVIKIVDAFKKWKTATEGLTLAQKMLNLSIAANPIGLIISLIAGLIAGFIYLWNTSEGFRNFWIGLWNSVSAFFNLAWQSIMNFFTGTVPAWIGSIKEWFGGLGTWFSELWGNIKQFFVNGWNAIANFFTVRIPAWISSVGQWFSELWSNIKQLFSNGWNAIVEFFTVSIPAWIESVGQWFSQLPYKIGYALGQALGTIAQWGINVWNYLVENVPLWIKGVIDWFKQLPSRIWNALVEAFNAIIQFGADVWNKAKEIGSNMVDGVISFVKWLPSKLWNLLVDAFHRIIQFGADVWNKAKEIGKNMVDGVISFVKWLPSKLWNLLVSAFKSVVSWGKNLVSKAGEIGGNFTTWLINAVSNLPSQMFEIGKNIVQGVWNGIKSAGSWLKDKVGNFFGGLVAGVKEKMDIHSPSRVMRDQVGKYMAMGVGVGFTDQMDKVNKEIQNSIAIPNVPTIASLREDSRREDYSNLIGAIMSLANRPAKFEIDGREIMIALAPHQDEFTEYNKIHNVNYAY